MRSNRDPRGLNSESASYLLLRPSGTNSRVNPLRRMNSRLRYALLFSLVIALTLLFVNFIIIRLDRPSGPLRVFDRTLPGESSYHTESDDVLLQRLQRGHHRTIKLPQKLVHLDLKGAPLNVNYLENVLPLLKKLGATGLLIEYEDMFPYNGKIANISAKNSYSTGDIRKILLAARANELSVIPLIQTFGHLESALKLQQFTSLREVIHNPQAICPSRNASLQLVEQMLNQIATLHQGFITHIHIGSDEVYALGECEQCQERMMERSWLKSDLFMSHVSNVVAMVQKLNLQPIVWDDMFRNVDEDLLKKTDLVKLVEIMVWNYNKNVDLVGVFSKYVSAGFRGLWIASAFKGALSPINQMPEYKLHLLNHYSWIQLLKQFEGKVQINGIALTGWQRFDHFGSLCELFPVGLPVLAVCLAYLQTGGLDEKTLSGVRQALNCNRNNQLKLNEQDLTSLSYPQTSYMMPPNCLFPGSSVFTDVLRWSSLKERHSELLKTNYVLGWMSSMNRKHQFSSPEHLLTGTRDVPDLLSDLSRLEQIITEDFATVFDRATAKEWIETFIEPMENSLKKLLEDAEEMLMKKSWPRRPFYNINRKVSSRE